MIHEEICTYEVAKLAKEKGFPQDVFGTCEMKSSCYLEDGRYYKDGCIYPIENAYTAPTQSLLQRWLREEKEVFVEVHTHPHFATTHTKTFYVWNIQYCDCKQAYGMLQDPQDTFCSYEEALEDALKYALENLV